MDSSRNRAVRTYRARLEKQGLARFEVLGREGDQQLVRRLARRLAEGGPEADRLRQAIEGQAEPAPARGGLLGALRRSPLVGADLDLERERPAERPIRL